MGWWSRRKDAKDKDAYNKAVEDITKEKKGILNYTDDDEDNSSKKGDQ